MKIMRIHRFILQFLLGILLTASSLTAHALEPEEVLVIANKNVAPGIKIARYYMKQRAIPANQLLILDLTQNETCSRQEYETNVIPDVRSALKQHPQIRVLVTMFGVPLKISPAGHTPAEMKVIQSFQKEKNAIETLLTGNTISDFEQRKQKHDLLSEINLKLKEFLKKIDKAAAFDSELALVKNDNYPLSMWIPNPFYLPFRNQKKLLFSQSDVLMVSRLDGPSVKIVKRIIDDSIVAQVQGLKGRAYFDARWKYPAKGKMPSAYAVFDKSIHDTARLLMKTRPIKVVLNDDPGLFQKNDSPDTALYCGWYSLAKYVDAFKWQKGSVGYHIASAECTTLKKKNSKVWCKKMLDNGIAVTIGPTGEPYVQSFPTPEIFFNYVTEGYLTVAESYLISVPYLSWKMVLIADPLYKVKLIPPRKS